MSALVLLLVSLLLHVFNHSPSRFNLANLNVAVAHFKRLLEKLMQRLEAIIMPHGRYQHLTNKQIDQNYLYLSFYYVTKLLSHTVIYSLVLELLSYRLVLLSGLYQYYLTTNNLRIIKSPLFSTLLLIFYVSPHQENKIRIKIIWESR